MNKKDVFKTKNVYILGGIAFFLVLTALCAFSFHSSAKRQAATAYVFDGWYFGREDQKRVGSVLSAAGLNDYTWESGKLSVPTAKKNEYQSALAVAGAYPKAPGESRLEALRESNVFESDSKLRMRELNACATQLERTIEQMRDVEYATVGYRSRREQSGLVSKNVVTASVGVALKEGIALDANFLVAITIAAKHQLGIDEADNISILDLKAGKSYLGVDSSLDAEVSDVTILEKERVENYWREKYLEAFGDIEGVRVSVVADLVDANNGEKTSDVSLDNNQEVNRLLTVAYTKSNENQDVEVPSRNGRSVLRTRSLTKENDESGFVRLGNPKKKNVRTNVSNQIRPLEVTKEKGVATNSPTPCLPLDSKGLGRRLENMIVLASRSTNETEEELDGSKRLEEVNSAYFARPRKANVGGGIAQTGYFEKNDSNTKSRSANAELVLRSIIVRIAVPESYVQRVFQRVVAENNKGKTFEEESGDEREALYRDTESKIIEETKKFAVALFRPTGERLGWNDDALENSFYVDVFSDASTSNAADTVNFVSKYASFDMIESESKAPEQSAAEKIAGDAPKDADVSESGTNDVQKDASVSENGVNDSNADSTTESEEGALAKTFEKIAELATTEETDDEAAFGALVKKLFEYCVKASKSPQTLVAAILDSIAALLFFFYLKYKKILKKKAKGVAGNVKDEAKSNKEPNQDGTTQKVDKEDEIFDDELEQELLNIASLASSKRAGETPKVRNDSTSSNERNFWEQRQTALDLIARYPERAAASLQSWVKNPSVGKN